MTKWADYGIFAVRYNEKHTHIEKVKALPDLGDKMGSEIIFTRQEVIDKIEKGETFVTILKNKDGNWSKGQEVEVVVIKGTKYIKTIPNDTECDNLGELPEF